MKKLFLSFIIIFFSISIYAEIGKIRMIYNDLPSSSVTIVWTQESGRNPFVCFDTEYGLNKDNKLSYVVQPMQNWNYKGMDNFSIRLDNLQPNSTYYFVVFDSEGASEQYWFRTLQKNPSKLSIIAGGDSRTNRDIRQLGNKMVAKLQPDFVIFDGDFVAYSSNSQWQNWLDDWQLTIADNRIIPIVPAMGNHEAEGDVEKIFGSPENSIYSINFGNLLHITILNTENTIEGQQTDWFIDDLQKSFYFKWKFVAFHKPIRPHYSSKPEGDLQYSFWAIPIFENNVNIVIEGDSHTCKITYPIEPDINGNEGFVRNDSTGTTFIGEGSWGAPLRAADDLKPWTLDAEMVNQFKWIFVDTNKIEIRTVLFENVDEVENLNFDNRFQIPQKINLWKPNNIDVVILN